jgi:hypothetical protein
MLLENLLAAPLTPSIRVRIGPNDAIEVDQAAFENEKEMLRAFCQSIPQADDGLSWRVLKAHTGNNGLMAKLLIGLGEVLGIWKMYPDPGLPELWQSSLFPMIQAGSMAPSVSEVPKPSRGELEVGESCACCQRTMNEYNGLLLEGYEFCWECADAGCVGDGDCQLEKKAELRLVKPAEPEEEPADIDSYLKQFQ